jgi:hypothetical protein
MDEVALDNYSSIGPEPAWVKTVIGNQTEVELIAALDSVVRAFTDGGLGGLDPWAMSRAVDWLYARYGSKSE